MSTSLVGTHRRYCLRTASDDVGGPDPDRLCKHQVWLQLTNAPWFSTAAEYLPWLISCALQAEEPRSSQVTGWIPVLGLAQHDISAAASPPGRIIEIPSQDCANKSLSGLDHTHQYDPTPSLVDPCLSARCLATLMVTQRGYGTWNVMT